MEEVVEEQLDNHDPHMVGSLIDLLHAWLTYKHAQHESARL